MRIYEVPYLAVNCLSIGYSKIIEELLEIDELQELSFIVQFVSSIINYDFKQIRILFFIEQSC